MKNNQNLKSFIESGVFSSTENNLSSVLAALQKYSTSTLVKIVYGETYDELGLTLDSLKYYFIVHILGELIGIENVESSIIVGDLASLRNQKSLKNESSITEAIKKNLVMISKVISSYRLNSKPVLMSEEFKGSQFTENFHIVTDQYHRNQTIKDLFKKTVLENRLKQEQESDFLYSREEVAVIMNYDIKVGPPREKYYDQAASTVKTAINSSPLQAIYVKPTFPLGFNFDYFICNPEVEQYGITPYKAGSNKLQSHRVILKDIKPDVIKELFDKSFLPRDSMLPNPLLDLYIIADLAKRIIEKDYNFPDYHLVNIDRQELYTSLNNYIFSRI